MWTQAILFILKTVLTSKPVRHMAAKVIQEGVRSTKTKLDDVMAKPVLEYLLKD